MNVMNEVVILVPARGGSQRLPGKNLKLLAGKSLVQRTAEFAKTEAGDISVYLSTDSPAIAEAGALHGWKIPFLRPDYLATDQATSAEVALHFLDHLDQKKIRPRILVLLQLTSPFRPANLLRETVHRMLVDPSIPAMVAMKDLGRTSRNIFTIDEEKRGAYSLSPDQRLLLTPNGALYAIRADVFKEKRTFTPDGLLPLLLNEIESIDIDTPFDWEIAESMAAYWDNKNG